MSRSRPRLPALLELPPPHGSGAFGAGELGNGGGRESLGAASGEGRSSGAGRDAGAWLDNPYDAALARTRLLTGVLALAERLARTPTPVLIRGGIGTCKHVIARALHRSGEGREALLERVSAARFVPAHVLPRIGREGRGTLIIDDVLELSPAAQASLLEWLGRSEPAELQHARRPAGVRLVGITRHVPEDVIEAGRLLPTLGAAFDGATIVAPTLRDRYELVCEVASALAPVVASRAGKPAWRLGSAALAALERYAWPGDVRELLCVLERSVRAGPSAGLELALGRHVAGPLERERIDELADADRELISAMLQRTAGLIEGFGGAAERLGMSPTTLRFRMRRLGIPGRCPSHGGASSRGAPAPPHRRERRRPSR